MFAKTFLLAAAMAVASVSADTCDVAALTPLLSNENYDKCATDSGGYAFTSGKVPTDDQAEAMCESDACKKMLSDVGEMDLDPDCEIPLGDGQTNLQTDIIDKVTAACGGDAPAEESPAEEAPAKEEESPAATTAAAETEAPAAEEDKPAATPASTPASTSGGEAPTSTHAAC